MNSHCWILCFFCLVPINFLNLQFYRDYRSYFVFNGGTVDGNNRSIGIFQFYAAGVDIKFTGKKSVHDIFSLDEFS